MQLACALQCQQVCSNRTDLSKGIHMSERVKTLMVLERVHADCLSVTHRSYMLH